MISFILIAILLLALAIVSYNNYKNKETYDTKLESLKREYVNEKNKALCNKQIEELSNELKEKRNELITINEKIQENKNNVEFFETFKSTLDASKNNFIRTLESAYTDAELDYDNKLGKLNAKYEEYQSELETMKKLYHGLQESNRLQELEENKVKSHMIEISDNDLKDIIFLEEVKDKLTSNKRVLSMLIWQSYYQKPLKQMSTALLGGAPVTGIYKITNKNNNKCYVGQARDVQKRWAEHVKKGLGIDTPVNNKFYNAMIKDGVHNFTFELLTECKVDELNELERKYIDFYESTIYGYNTLKGNK